MEKPGAFGPPLCSLIDELLSPGHFLLRGDARLEWQRRGAEEIGWEIFQGRLLDAAQTRQRRRLEAWNLYWLDSNGRSTEPLLAVKLDAQAGRLFVVRSILCHAWEAYDEGNNVIHSRPVRKWLRELVAAVALEDFADLEALRPVLGQRLLQAVVGLSRLPLISVEGPLPAFTFGQLAYFPWLNPPGSSGPIADTRALLDQVPKGLSLSATARLLEVVIRATPPQDLGAASLHLGRRWQALGLDSIDFPALFLAVFDEVALSPYTDFVPKTLALLGTLVEHGPLTPAQHADCLTGLLGRIGRHLTAFDLVKFHHQGANYPDALLLDALLKAGFALAQRHPELFSKAQEEPREETWSKRLRRRGLRQGWLMRQRYLGHPVPELPTSPGENARVLPPEYPRVPEEQIVDPSRRPRRLFADEPFLPQLSAIGRQLLQQSISELDLPRELWELGTALFLDRPLGIFKRPGEPDQTLLLSYVAFSASVAQRQLRFIARHLPEWLPDSKSLEQRLLQAPPGGVPLKLQPLPVRPGVPSLQDAFQVAPDFVLLRTTRRAVNDFLAQYDLEPLARRLELDWLTTGTSVLIVGGAALGKSPTRLCFFDAAGQQRLELEVDPGAGYSSSGLVEHPAGGLQLVQGWERGPRRAAAGHEPAAEDVWIKPKGPVATA